MKINTFFRTIIEIIAVLGLIVTGVTALTYVIQNDATIDKTVIALVIAAIGGCGVLEFLSLKSLAKIKSIPNLIAALLGIALGVVILILNIDIPLTCILWGAITIGIQIIKVVNNALNITQKPLTCGLKSILCLVEIVFCIILIIKKEVSIESHFVFIGVSLLIEASLTLVGLFFHHD